MNIDKKMLQLKSDDKYNFQKMYHTKINPFNNAH